MTLSPTPPRVVVAMSGGVDSSVAAGLLVQQGYQVIGMMMRLWSEPASGPGAPTNRCCTPDQMADARRVADHLDIPFYVIDARDTFRRHVVQFFLDEHRRGRTPNPCVECNRTIRFDFLLKHAQALGADFLATGHYARIRHTEEGYQLLRAVDESKDQSYVLHVLGQAQLACVKFPVGDYPKSQVRQLAGQMGLAVGQKRESMDLCFLADRDYRRFLRQHAPQLNRAGPILNRAGQELGWHQGLAFYTIGQRKGLGVAAPEPLYVLGKDAGRNALIVGTRQEVGQKEVRVRDVTWVAGTMPASAGSQPLPVSLKIRYRARPVQALVRPAARPGEVQVTLHQPLPGITPGQAAVFYQGDVCLGGGLIADDTPAGGGGGEEA